MWLPPQNFTFHGGIGFGSLNCGVGWMPQLHKQIPHVWWNAVAAIIRNQRSVIIDPALAKLVSPCLPVHPSVGLWIELCLLHIFHNTSLIYFIFTHLINQILKVSHVLIFFKLQNLANVFSSWLHTTCSIWHLTLTSLWTLPWIFNIIFLGLPVILI